MRPDRPSEVPGGGDPPLLGKSAGRPPEGGAEPVLEGSLTAAERRAEKPRRGRQLRGNGGVVGLPIADMPPPPEVVLREAFFRRALVLADALAVTSALLLAIVIIGNERLPATALLGIPVTLLLSKLAGLYDRDELLIRKTTTLDEVPGLVNVATVVTLLGAILQGAELSAGLLLTLWGSLAACLALFRSAARRFSLRHTPVERCLVAGDADAAAQVGRRTAESPYTNSLGIGYLPLRGQTRREDPGPLGTLDQLDDVIRSHRIHRIIVAPRDTVGSELSLDVIRRSKALGIKVSVLPRILEVIGSAVAFDDVDGITVLGVRRFGLPRSSAFVKRSHDLAIAGLLPLLTGALIAIVALAIRLDSRGPVFFRQVRVGRDGKPFPILKFRTMTADAERRRAELEDRNETTGLFKLTDDPRVTRVSRWLRRTSLDELPQLVNVLRGEMSLVGPRPLVPEEDARIAGWHRRRLYIKPGMTGPWQILGSTRIPLYEMVKLDYLYVATGPSGRT